MTNDYEVGHGKPPVANRWKKGQSGSPKGRPKTKHESLRTYAEILSEPVTARTPDGRSVSLGSLEAAYLAQCKKALKGDNAALFAVLRIMLEVLPRGIEQKQKRESECLGAKEKFMEMLGVEIED